MDEIINPFAESSNTNTIGSDEIINPFAAKSSPSTMDTVVDYAKKGASGATDVILKARDITSGAIDTAGKAYLQAANTIVQTETAGITGVITPFIAHAAQAITRLKTGPKSTAEYAKKVREGTNELLTYTPSDPTAKKIVSTAMPIMSIPALLGQVLERDPKISARFGEGAPLGLDEVISGLAVEIQKKGSPIRESFEQAGLAGGTIEDMAKFGLELLGYKVSGKVSEGGKATYHRVADTVGDATSLGKSPLSVDKAPSVRTEPIDALKSNQTIDGVPKQTVPVSDHAKGTVQNSLDMQRNMFAGGKSVKNIGADSLRTPNYPIDSIDRQRRASKIYNEAIDKLPYEDSEMLRNMANTDPMTWTPEQLLLEKELVGRIESKDGKVKMRPAVIGGDGVLHIGKEGDTHNNIIQREGVYESKRVFVDENNNVLGREQAGNKLKFDEPQVAENLDGKSAEGELHSEDLNAARDKVEPKVEPVEKGIVAPIVENKPVDILSPKKTVTPVAEIPEVFKNMPDETLKQYADEYGNAHAKAEITRRQEEQHLKSQTTEPSAQGKDTADVTKEKEPATFDEWKAKQAEQPKTAAERTPHFNKDEADARLKRLNARLGGKANMGAFLDPEVYADALYVAGHKIETGLIKFMDFAESMVDDLGEAIRQHLQKIWDELQNHPALKAVWEEEKIARDKASRPEAKVVEEVVESTKEPLGFGEWGEKEKGVTYVKSKEKPNKRPVQSPEVDREVSKDETNWSGRLRQSKESTGDGTSQLEKIKEAQEIRGNYQIQEATNDLYKAVTEKERLEADFEKKHPGVASGKDTELKEWIDTQTKTSKGPSDHVSYTIDRMDKRQANTEVVNTIIEYRKYLRERETLTQLIEEKTNLKNSLERYFPDNANRKLSSYAEMKQADKVLKNDMKHYNLKRELDRINSKIERGEATKTDLKRKEHIEMASPDFEKWYAEYEADPNAPKGKSEYGSKTKPVVEAEVKEPVAKQVEPLTSEQQKMVENNRGLVGKKVQENIKRGASEEQRQDLMQAGYEGLIEAAKTFDPNKGEFSTHAMYQIRAAIDKALGKPTTKAERLLWDNMGKAEASLRKELGREPTNAETAKSLGVKESEVADWKNRKTESLDNTTADGESSLMDKLEAKSINPDEKLDNATIYKKLYAAIDKLPEREQAIIRGTYIDNKTLAEIGTELNLSAERVRQIREQALKTLKNDLTNRISAVTEAKPAESLGAAKGGGQEFMSPLGELTEIVSDIYPEQKVSGAQKAINWVKDYWKREVDNVKGIVQIVKPDRDFTRDIKKLSGALDVMVDAVKHPTEAYTKAVQASAPKWSMFKEAFGDMLMLTQRSSREAYLFSKRIVAAVKDPKVREAITNYVQADGDMAVLADRYNKSLSNEKTSKYAEGYLEAQKLSPEQVRLANEIIEFHEKILKSLMDAGVLESGLKNYIMQAWESKDVGAMNNYRGGGAFLEKNPSIAKKRVHDTYFDGEQKGRTPKTKDVAELTALYSESAYKAIGSKSLIETIKKGVGTDGRPLTAPVRVSLDISEDISRMLDTSDYKVVNHSALKGHKFASIEKGKTLAWESDIKVHPEIYDQLHATLGSSIFADSKLYKGVSRVSREYKSALLSGIVTFFHQFHVGTHAGFRLVNPFIRATFDINSPSAVFAMKSGMRLVSDMEGRMYWQEGSVGTKGSLVSRIPIMGQLTQKYGDYFFSNYLPALKLKSFESAVDYYTKKHGEGRTGGARLTKEQIGEIAARDIEASYGELNYEWLGRSKTARDTFRLIALAPDFLEARARFMGGTFLPERALQRRTIAIDTMAMYLGALTMDTVLNKDDNETWQTAMLRSANRPFKVVKNGYEFSLRSIPADVYHLVTDPTSFISGRLNPATVRSLITAVNGYDSRGKYKDTTDQILDYFKGMTPIAAQGLFKEGDIKPWMSIVKSFGINVTMELTPFERALKKEYAKTISITQSKDVREQNSLMYKYTERLRQSYKYDDDANWDFVLKTTKEQIAEDVRKGKLPPEADADIYERLTIDRIAHTIKPMSLETIMNAFGSATSEQQEYYFPLIAKKFLNHQEKHPEDVKTVERFQKIFHRQLSEMSPEMKEFIETIDEYPQYIEKSKKRTIGGEPLNMMDETTAAVEAATEEVRNAPREEDDDRTR